MLTNTTSPCLSPEVPVRAQGLHGLQQDISNNLAKFRQRTVKSHPASWADISRLADKNHWFSNDYPTPRRVQSGPYRSQEAIRLGDSFARLPAAKPLADYRIAIIVGEGGILQGLPELAASCDLTLQIDRESGPLQLITYLLEECRKETSYPESHTEKIALLNRAITRLQAANPEVGADNARDIALQFCEYITGMERNLFSSAERFAEFKRCQDHPVQQVYLDYFSEEAMSALAEILKDHNASVRFLNIGNACEYPEEFYEGIPYDDNGMDIGLTPSRYVQRLPFSDDAICAYSQLCGGRIFTATATIPEMADALYGCAISGRDSTLRALASRYDGQLFTWLIKDAASAASTFRDLQMIAWFLSCYGTGPSHQLPTRIFRFFAQHPINTMHDWILRLTAARLTRPEVEELKAHKEALKSDYLQNHPTHMDTQPPLFIKILDRITAEPRLAETGQPVDSTASSQAAAEEVTAVPMQLV
ncbi:hypothetical protein [Endozoicomonas sp. SESOKO1]|uniref:hypothetical protein n=1 Tax=Endozoicomonas sp. SESOKO1 TaxID=2828742 RepID=UPI0021490910|nr:hypothetical protein [Endozoicomonas sp. SESOKO1]